MRRLSACQVLPMAAVAAASWRPPCCSSLLADQPAAAPYRQLLVGTETGDDAAVWQVDDDLCIVATTDFFMPVVDDPARLRPHRRDQCDLRCLCHGRPADHGARHPRHAARQDAGGDGARASCGAASGLRRGRNPGRGRPFHRLARADLWARGDRPMPARADQPQCRHEVGDAIILTKAIGVGVYSAALKKGELSGTGYAEMIASTTLLNRIGADLAKDHAVHAMTDVTGFGLLGHGLEMARGASLSLTIRLPDVPFLKRGRALRPGRAS